MLAPCRWSSAADTVHPLRKAYAIARSSSGGDSGSGSSRRMASRAHATASGRQATPTPDAAAWKSPPPSGTSSNSSSRPLSRERPPTVPLKAVVQDAVVRWFADTLIEARAGDVKQQAMLAQMYAEGYGCEQDVKAAKDWSERARKRGYRQLGVYCEL